MIVNRLDIIEGIIRIRIQGEIDQIDRLIAKMSQKFTNDELCELYYTATKTHIRQIFHDRFFILN
jgi:hypothetical protein